MMLRATSRALGAFRGRASPVRCRGMAVIPSSVSDVPLSQDSVTKFILERADDFGDRPAFINGVTGESVAFNELRGAIAATAESLSGHGFGSGDVLSIHLPNCPQYAMAFHGAAVLGGASTTSNPLYTPSELRHQLQDSKAKCMVTSRMFAEVAGEAVKGTGVEKVWFLEDEDCPISLKPSGAELPSSDVDPSSTLVLPYSSGTTGLPKGVVLSHGNVTANLSQFCDHPELNLGLRPADMMLGVLPFFHIYGMVVIMNAALRQGATVVTLPKFDPEMFLTAMQQHSITFAPLVPPLVLFLAKHPVVAKFDLSSLRTIFSGAAPLDAELQSAAQARLEGVSIRQGYGMTEMSPVSTLCPEDDVVPGSAGKLVPNAQARIVDVSTGEDVEDGSTGELWVKGPHIMQGYLNNPKATAETLTDDGWLRSGDIAYHEDGHFFVVDRLKELIKVKGYQVAPAELEGLLLQHKEIVDCAVIGIKDERSGEVPKAFVVLAPESKMTEEDVKAVLADTAASYKQLGEVEIVAEIPKSAAGKILKRVLRE